MEHGAGALRGHGAGSGLMNVFGKDVPVRQARQAVVPGHVADFLGLASQALGCGLQVERERLELAGAA